MMNKVSNAEFKLNDNSFDVLRIIGAFIVVFSHSFRHFELTKPIWSLYFMDGSIGVMIFFAITGYVIMPAWERAQNKKHPILSFYWNRIIRIYPGLFFSFLLITLIDFFLMRENVLSPHYLVYMLKYCVFAQGAVYGVNGLSNGVLWTIPVDIVFYLLVPLVWRIGKKLRVWHWIIIIIFFWQFNIFDSEIISLFRNIPILGKTVGEGFPLCFLYQFLIGVFFYFKRDLIVVFFIRHKLVAFGFLGFFTIFYEFIYLTDFFQKDWVMHSPIIAILAVPLVIIIGYAMGNHHIKIDFSYGLFLVHMIAVGTLKYIGITGLKGVFLVIVLGTFLALVSYYLVEKPCLKLKKIIN